MPSLKEYLAQKEAEEAAKKASAAAAAAKNVKPRAAPPKKPVKRPSIFARIRVFFHTPSKAEQYLGAGAQSPFRSFLVDFWEVVVTILGVLVKIWGVALVLGVILLVLAIRYNNSWALALFRWLRIPL